jgi:hypothetical protein
LCVFYPYVKGSGQECPLYTWGARPHIRKAG